jgi:hypothetical protein
MEEKQIKNVDADSSHFFMAVPDMVVMFYGYIFPCLDSKRGNEAGDSVRRGDSSSLGTHTLSLYPNLTQRVCDCLTRELVDSSDFIYA